MVRTIKIEKLHDVFCVSVGCQRFYYFTPQALTAELDFYIRSDFSNISNRYFDAKEILDKRDEGSQDGALINAPPPAQPEVAPNVVTTEGQQPA